MCLTGVPSVSRHTIMSQNVIFFTLVRRSGFYVKFSSKINKCYVLVFCLTEIMSIMNEQSIIILLESNSKIKFILYIA
jgi:hypothetical protein